MKAFLDLWSGGRAQYSVEETVDKDLGGLYFEQGRQQFIVNVEDQ